jgi:hypothetical protein
VGTLWNSYRPGTASQMMVMKGLPGEPTMAFVMLNPLFIHDWCVTSNDGVAILQAEILRVLLQKFSEVVD